MVRDQIALVYALGYRKAELIVGHDQGQLMPRMPPSFVPTCFFA
jgi:hypothetical protein